MWIQSIITSLNLNISSVLPSIPGALHGFKFCTAFTTFLLMSLCSYIFSLLWPSYISPLLFLVSPYPLLYQFTSFNSLSQHPSIIILYLCSPLLPPVPLSLIFLSNKAFYSLYTDHSNFYINFHLSSLYCIQSLILSFFHLEYILFLFCPLLPQINSSECISHMFSSFV